MTSSVRSGSAIGIDVGGTSVKAARVERFGTVQASAVVRTPSDGGSDAVVDAIEHAVREVLTAEVICAGVVVPGLVDGGIVRRAVNVRLRDVDLGARLEAVFGVPFAVGHDVSAAAEAEAAASGEPDVLYVSIGTGIAAAHVRNGVVDRGASGQAGEIGHLSVVPDGEVCACGGRGCVETYASAAAIARRWRAASGAASTDVGDGAEDVAAQVAVDARAATVWSEAVEALAAGVTAAICVLDPSIVLLGGGLAQAGDALVVPLRASIRSRLAWRSPPPVGVGRLGTLAGQLGAARLAWRDVPGTKERSA